MKNLKDVQDFVNDFIIQGNNEKILKEFLEYIALLEKYEILEDFKQNINKQSFDNMFSYIKVFDNYRNDFYFDLDDNGYFSAGRVIVYDENSKSMVNIVFKDNGVCMYCCHTTENRKFISSISGEATISKKSEVIKLLKLVENN